MASPSISLPDEMMEEIDRRRPSTVSRSEWLRGAIQERFRQEDAGEWDDSDSDGNETTQEVAP